MNRRKERPVIPPSIVGEPPVNLDNLSDHEAQVYSQCGEDGVLQRIFEVIGADTRYFVEFGAWDGCHLSNTANLRIHHGWHGLLMEGSDRADEQLVRREFVHAENVDALFSKYEVPDVFDLLSIDIDGNEYWVWKALCDYRPRVVAIEYNVFFGIDVSKTMPYDATHRWDKTMFHGASLAALRKLGREKGYTLIHTDSYAPNAFFVLRDQLPADWSPVPAARAARWGAFDQRPDPQNRAWLEV
jgi:hypothetical protein